MISRILFVFVVLLTFVSSSLKAAETVVLYDGMEEVWVGSKRTVFFEDTSTSMTLEEVRAANTFSAHHLSDAMNEHPRSAYWLKFTLVDQRTKFEPLVLELFDFDVESMHFYYPDSVGNYQVKKCGYYDDFGARAIEHKNLNFELLPFHKDTVVCYLRFFSSKIKVLEPVIRTQKSLMNYALKEYMFLGVFYGLMVLMIVYNFIYFIIIKRRSYLYYVLYAVFSMLYLMTQNGTAFQFLWPTQAGVNALVAETSLFLAMLSLLFFADAYLRGNCNFNLGKWLWVAVGLRVFVFGLQLFYHVQFGLVDVVYIQALLLLAFYTKLDQQSPSGWFILAIFILDLSFVISFLERHYLIPSNFFAVYSVNIGVVLQFIFLSISIAESVKEAYHTTSLTKQKLLEELDKTSSQNQRLKDFSYITSHNIRSSVSSLMSLIELVEVDKDPTQYQGMFKKVVSNLDKTISSTNQLLEVEQKHSKNEKEWVNLPELIQNIIDQNQELVRSKAAQVRVQIPEHMKMFTHLVYLESVLYNLINNAVKYGVTHNEKQVDISVVNEGSLTIIIRDYGLGIDLTKNRERIFEIGGRLTASSDGQGLGLYMVKNQLRILGGELEIESSLGNGTAVTIRFKS